jgi:hypothetical protein
MRRWVAGIVLAALVAACGPQSFGRVGDHGHATEPSRDQPAPVASAPSPIVLRAMPAGLACDAIGVGYDSVTFHIDSTTPGQVIVVTDQGTELPTFWADGYRAGGGQEGAIVGPGGQVVVVDGQELQIPHQDWPRLGDNFVCPTETALYIFEGDPP